MPNRKNSNPATERKTPHMSSPAAPLGHNRGPVTAPSDQELLDDLKARFPELEKDFAEFQDALKTYPTELTLKDEETARALQDLLGKIKKHKSALAGQKKDEKKPWSALVNVVTNFFETADSKLGGMLEEWTPRHQAYMDLVKAENLRKANEEAERQRAIEESNRKAAAEAEERRLAAEKAEAEARAREEQARRDAERAEADRKAAQERAAQAEAEERRLAAERKAREREEREIIEANLKAITRHLKTVATLHGQAEADEASDAELRELDGYIRPGGIISALATPVAGSLLLDEDQKNGLSHIKQLLETYRAASDARVGKRERTRRAKEAAEEEARQVAAAAERKRLRDEEEARQIAAREEREAAERQAAAGLRDMETARGQIREAKAETRSAQQEQKAAGKVERQAETDADRAANRADRIEYRLEKSTDAEIAGTLRGELGTKGSLTRRWTLKIVDEDALRAVCGPLGPTFTEDALNGAAYRWMLNRISGWSGRERVEGELPGVVFAYQQGARIS